MQAKAELAEEMLVFQQHQADLMMEFSKQHQQEAQAASHRLRVVTEKKDVAETQLALIQRQHAEVCEQLHKYCKQADERSIIAAEDALAQVQRAVLHEQQVYVSWHFASVVASRCFSSCMLCLHRV